MTIAFAESKKPMKFSSAFLIVAYECSTLYLLYIVHRFFYIHQWQNDQTRDEVEDH